MKKKQKHKSFEDRLLKEDKKIDNRERVYGSIEYTFVPQDEMNRRTKVREIKKDRREKNKSRRSMRSIPGFNPRKKKFLRMKIILSE